MGRFQDPPVQYILPGPKRFTIFSSNSSINWPKRPFHAVFKQKNPEENEKMYETSYEPFLSTILQAIKAFLMHSLVIFSQAMETKFQSKAWIFLTFWEFWPLLATSGHLFGV